MNEGSRPRAGIARGLLAAAICVAVAGYVLWHVVSSSNAVVPRRAERDPQTSWAACNRNAGNRRASTFHPLSDRGAASLVTHEREVRPDNAKPYSIGSRRYAATTTDVPSAAQLRAFRGARQAGGQTAVQFNPYFRYVDGRDGLPNPSTDDLIQWAAHKWGIPEDWLRAEYVEESYWSSFQLGDVEPVSAAWYRRYPPQARVPNTLKVYESMGITQERWRPDNAYGPGSEPLRWESMAFNIDYQAATIRFYYDNPEGRRSAWGDASYTPCQTWNSIGGWYDPYPWNNPGQAQYIATARGHLAGRDWTRASFVHWTPSSLPAAIRFR